MLKDFRGLVATAGLGLAIPTAAANLSLSTNVLGPTPELLAYNSGHFFTNSNTKDWWRYAGVSGARVFLSPSEIEPADDLAPVGDGVSSQATFLARKAALRADPLNLSYINWAGSSGFSNRYENNDLYPNNHIRPNYTFREMRQLGLRICVQITAGQSRFLIADTNDWPNLWELWQHYYAQAFYLGRAFDVERYQMFNEPNHPNANGLTITNHLLRLQFISDAIQSALADVNVRYGNSLSPRILAPVTSGNADGSYAGWGESVVTNRHVNFLGQTDTNFSLFQIYDYHQYGSSPATFGSDLDNLHGFLTAAMSPESRYPTAISEFNTDTGASFDTQTETLDTPAKYSRLGAILVNLLANGISELYCFKFSQTEYTGNYPVQKNALHYVDNSNSPYNVGGITRAGEVYRLFNKAFAPGRQRVGVSKGSGASALDVLASYDPGRKRYHVFSVNNTTSSVAVEFALADVPAPIGNRVVLEEVSEANYGAVTLWTNVPAGLAFSGGSQPGNTVWLLTLPVTPQAPEQILAATDDAEVRDGTNRNVNYGSATSMTARNDPANNANRNAAFMKFNLGGIALTNVELAVLSLQVSTPTTNAVAQAHVYALPATNWSQSTITWATAPNLRQNVAAGNTISRQTVLGAGDTAHLVGQIVATSTNASERLLDVTDFLRRHTNNAFTFLISQDPRWDVALPSLDTGDTQPDGVRMLTTESGSGPRLRVILKATPTNSPPTAKGDFSFTTPNTAVVLSVLTNDYDADGDALAIVSVTQGAYGSVSNSGDGILTYTPAVNFTGNDRFEYIITDGRGGTNSATVNLLVQDEAGSPYWTNLTATTEAFVRGGVNAPNDQDEVATGYLMVKYNSPSLDNSRKVYFQFDLAGLIVDLATPVVLTVGFLNTFKQNVQLWALNQAYPDFTSAVTWNAAQANDVSNNSLLTGGSLSAAAIRPVTNLPASGTTPVSLPVPLIGNYLHSNRVTFVMTGAPDAGGFTNNPSGLRLLRTNAALQVRVLPTAGPAPRPRPFITGIAANPDGSVTMNITGAAHRIHWVQARTNLSNGVWSGISTNASGPVGAWSVTDSTSTNLPQRFYRAVLP